LHDAQVAVRHHLEPGGRVGRKKGGEGKGQRQHTQTGAGEGQRGWVG
jgi:hypothetical protein